MPAIRRLAVAVAAAACAIVPASALGITTTGFPDGGLHPNVGAILTGGPGAYAEVCSATLVSPTVVVTASHCTSYLQADARADFVTFDPTAVENAPDDPIPATAVTNPRYRTGYRDDVSVMVLSRPVASIAPASLPPLGYLDSLPLTQATRFTTVGYGTQEQHIGGGPPTFPFTGDRGYGIGGFNALTKEWLKVSQNASHGDSGACYGDSGGPTFLGAAPADGDTVLAVTSTGDGPCYATNVSSRTDTPSARAFLARFGL
jgi:secreted trypsin-like serine protease